MRRGDLPRRVACAIFFLLALSRLSAAEEPDVAKSAEKPLLPAPRAVTARNASFEVVAGDMLSAQYVATTGEMLAQRFSRMLPPARPALQPVLVTLVPAASWEGESQFVTRIFSGGQVKVSVRWGEGTSRSVMERALAQGHLTALAAGYAKGAVTVPLWLELAVQHLARTRAVPAHSGFLAARVNEGPLRLESVLSARRGDGAEMGLAPHAYWLLMFLEQEGRGKGQLQNFLIRLLRGEEPMMAMNAAYGEHLRSTSEAEMWWLVGLNDLIRSPGSPVLARRESRRRLMEFSRLTFEVNGESSRLFVEDLWKHRVSASLQDELRHRLRVVGVEMGRFHPYYHNAILSLSRIFETVLTADEEEYGEALAAFRHDLRTGDELAEDTVSILDDLELELNPAR